MGAGAAATLLTSSPSPQVHTALSTLSAGTTSSAFVRLNASTSWQESEPAKPPGASVNNFNQSPHRRGLPVLQRPVVAVNNKGSCRVAVAATVAQGGLLGVETAEKQKHHAASAASVMGLLGSSGFGVGAAAVPCAPPSSPAVPRRCRPSPSSLSFGDRLTDVPAGRAVASSQEFFVCHDGRWPNRRPVSPSSGAQSCSRSIQPIGRRRGRWRCPRRCQW